MKTLAIDPGPKKSAVLLWDGEKVETPAILDNDRLLSYLRAEAPECLLAVEMIACYGMPVGAETFETCLFIGRIQEIWLEEGFPFKLVYRREVKMHLCGTMKAKDANIRQSLIDKFGPMGTKKAPGKLYGVKSHLWSALAIAVTVNETKG